MANSQPTIIVEHIDRVVRITMDRASKMNPLTAKCIREILSVVAEAETDTGTRAIIIRGSGKAFSSGYGAIAEDTEPGLDHRPLTIQDDVDAMTELGRNWARVWNCRIPVIAQVHGYCLAGGTDLALHCDVIVAADDARIGFPPVRSMGVPPTNMWLYHIGPQRTKRLLLTGDTVSGTEAAEMGLVLSAVPAEMLDEFALDLAQRMARVSRDLLIANKRVINFGVELMGRSQLQHVAAIHDAVGHRAPEAVAFSVRASEVGLAVAAKERDAPFAT